MLVSLIILAVILAVLVVVGLAIYASPSTTTRTYTLTAPDGTVRSYRQ